MLFISTEFLLFKSHSQRTGKRMHLLNDLIFLLPSKGNLVLYHSLQHTDLLLVGNHL